jgi:tRNA1(Val) A37 N6-methylase TrmN6
MQAEAQDVTDDAILNGRLRLLQPKRGHRFGHDAILLAAAVNAEGGQRVVEFGAGVGAASLALLARVPDIEAVLVEREAGLCALAAENIARNGFADRARVAELDVTAGDFAAAGLAAGGFDHVFMNPPFNAARHQASPHAPRRTAHVAEAGILPRWTQRAAFLLRAGGSLTLIWRADDWPAVVDALRQGFGSLALMPVYPAPGRPAIRVVAAAVKGGRGPARLAPPLTLNDGRQQPTEAAERILRGGEAWPLQLPD